MSVKTVVSFFYILHRALTMVDGLQQHYEETGTYILVIFSRIYVSSILDSVMEQVACLKPYHLC
jgi:hypothetical protein